MQGITFTTSSPPPKRQKNDRERGRKVALNLSDATATNHLLRFHHELNPGCCGPPLNTLEPIWKPEATGHHLRTRQAWKPCTISDRVRCTSTVVRSSYFSVFVAGGCWGQVATYFPPRDKGTVTFPQWQAGTDCTSQQGSHNTPPTLLSLKKHTTRHTHHHTPLHRTTATNPLTK